METKRLSSSSRICFPELTDYCGMAMGASPSGKLQTYSQSLYQSHRPISWFFFFFARYMDSAVINKCSTQWAYACWLARTRFLQPEQNRGCTARVSTTTGLLECFTALWGHTYVDDACSRILSYHCFPQILKLSFSDDDPQCTTCPRSSGGIDRPNIPWAGKQISDSRWISYKIPVLPSGFRHTRCYRLRWEHRAKPSIIGRF